MNMGTAPMELIERIRGNKLSSEEKDMLIRLKDELRCSDDDAIWQVAAVFEYQKKFYLELPLKLSETTGKILGDVSKTAEREVAIAQGKLAESVVAHAKKLSLACKLSTLVMAITAGIAVLFLICALNMWAGYQLGSGKAQPPEFMFQMPAGLMIGILLVGTAIGFCRWAAKEYAEEQKRWWRWMLAGFGCAIPAAWIFAVTV